jgi:hypothetical protein
LILEDNLLKFFSWKNVPKGLKSISLGYNYITSFNWEGSPEGLETINLKYNKMSICFRNSPINLKKVFGFQEQFKHYLQSKECRLDRAKYTRPIADMITHANLVESNIPVLKKYACREFYKVVNDFKEYSNENTQQQ